MKDGPIAASLSREHSPIVFVNSAAGAGRARVYLPLIQRTFASLRVEAQFVTTGSAEQLESCTQQAIKQGRRLLLAMGGDGTFQALANAAFGDDVVLGILPLGGGNDFASALGISNDPVRAAEEVLAGEPRYVDLVKVCTGDGRTRLYAGGGGIGLDAEAARYASGAYRHLPGRFRYIASALRALAGFDSPGIRIDFPDGDFPPFEMKALLTAALNSPSYGGGIRLAPDASVDDGVLDVVAIEELSLFEIMTLLPRLMVSGQLRTSAVNRWRAKRVRFTTEGPFTFHGDGEILGPTPVDVEIVPRAVRVLVPKRS